MSAIRLFGLTLWAGVMPGQLRSWFVGRLPAGPWTFRVRVGRFAIEVTRNPSQAKDTP